MILQKEAGALVVKVAIIQARPLPSVSLIFLIAQRPVVFVSGFFINTSVLFLIWFQSDS